MIALLDTPSRTALSGDQIRQIRRRHAALPRRDTGRTPWSAIKQLAIEMKLPYRVVTNVIAGRVGRHIATEAEAMPAMNLMLRLLQNGLARFESGEFCFEGLRYSALDGDWSEVVNVIGWEKMRMALSRGAAI